MPCLSIALPQLSADRRHDVEAQRRRLRGLQVEVAGGPEVAPAAADDRHLVDVREHRLLADLVDDAAGRAAPEQHRRRAAQQLDPVEVEDVAVVERRVADVVGEDVAARRQREAAQADVLLAALGRLEGDAGGVVQRVLHGVGAAVLEQLLGEDGRRLRHVAEVLVAAADGRRRRPHRVLVGLGLGADGGRREHGRARRRMPRPPATAPTLPMRPAAVCASAAGWNNPKPAASAPSERTLGVPGKRVSAVRPGRRDRTVASAHAFLWSGHGLATAGWCEERRKGATW